MVPASFSWDDVGDFASLSALVAAGSTSADGVTVIGDPADVVSVDASGLVAARGGRLVAVVGLGDVGVIDTPDALLVVARDRAQDVKAVVDRLEASGRDDLT